MIRKCVNLRHFRWTGGGDSRSDAARSERLNVQNESEVAWFFGGLLGDTPCLRGKYGWKTVEGDNDETEEDEGQPGEWWPLPHLESIETTWMYVPDLVIARLLKRLHRLTNLKLISPHFGPLAFRELSCPVLEDFAAATVNMTGILKRNTDWACHKLKRLSLAIVFDGIPTSYQTTATATTKEAQKTVYTQLARLQDLKTFKCNNHAPPANTFELQLNLAYGLDHLSTW
ncbi:hypothetical protein BGZ89_005438, partial [Linnemannia elongata]